MDRYQKEGDEAKLAYKHMLDHFLNEIEQVDQKTPSYPTEPKWWLNMMKIRDLITRLMDEMG